MFGRINMQKPLNRRLIILKESKQQSVKYINKIIHKLINSLNGNNLQKTMNKFNSLYKTYPKLIRMHEATVQANVYYKDTVLMDFKSAINQAAHNLNFDKVIQLAKQAKAIKISSNNWFQRDKTNGKYFNLRPSGVSSVANILLIDFKNQTKYEYIKENGLNTKILAKGKKLNHKINQRLKKHFHF